MNWQDISSIPRDQTTVLVCMLGSTDHYYIVAFEDGDEDDLGLQWRCPNTGDILLTENDFVNSFVPPMWCAITSPPTSTNAGRLA